MKQNMVNEVPLSEGQVEILKRLERIEKMYARRLTVRQFYMALVGVVAILALLWILFP